MRRAFKIAFVAGCSILGVLLTLTFSFAFLLFTGPGNTLVGSLTGWLSGGTVSISGLSGSLPNSIRAKSVDISDAQGVWLHVENLSLVWDAIGAIQHHIRVHSVAASKIAVLRRPVEEKSEGTTPQIDVDSIDAPRIDIAAAVAGYAATLKASGSLHYLSRHQLNAKIDISQIGAAGHYKIDGGIANDIAQGSVSIVEDSKGILGSILDLPGLGPINLSAKAFENSGANHIGFVLSAGALKAQGAGTFALAQRHADIDFKANAPAMKPSADLAWASLQFDGHMHGAFDTPNVSGRLLLRGASLSGIRMAALDAQVAGDQGVADLSGTVSGLRIPGDHPDLFAQAPVSIAAHADLDAATRPVTFKISHPLLVSEGRVETRGKTKLAVTVTLPALEPFAKLTNQDLRGHASAKIDVEQDAGKSQLSVHGQIDAQGTSLVARVLGPNASFAVQATTSGADIIHSDATLAAKALDFRAYGALRAKRIAYDVSVKLRDISRFSHALAGSATLSGRIAGPIGAADMSIQGNALIASPGFQAHRIDLTAQAKGFPRLSEGQLRVSGILNGAPVLLKVDLSQKSGTITANETANWKSLRTDGAFVFPGKSAPSGKAKLDIGQLADLAPLLSMDLKGHLASTAVLAPRGKTSMASLSAQLSGVAISGTTIEAATAAGKILDPLGSPSLDFNLVAHHFSAGTTSGDAKAKVSGPLRNLEIAGDATLNDLPNQPTRLSTAAKFDTTRNQLLLERLSAQWRGQSANLKAPANIDLENGVKVDRIVLQAGGGEISLAGRITPALSASAAVRSVDAEILQPFLSTPLHGVLSGDAEVSGTLEESHGIFAVHAHDLIAKAYFPKTPINIDAQGKLHGQSATLDAKLSAGSSIQIALTGEAPLRNELPMKLHVRGDADLAFTDLVLAAEGRRLRGTLAMDADVTGTFSAPRLSGGGTLKNGELQDYARGMHIRAIDAAFSGEGQSLRITRLSGRAGPGTISGGGQIDFAAPGVPLDLSLQIENARPLVSDLITATASGDVRVSGMLEKSLNIEGKLDISRGTINIPDRFPPEVAVLDVRRKNAQPPLPQASGGPVGLDLAISTSGPIFVRGRGIDADMGGSLHLGGTAAAPLASGGFEMNRGTLSLAGQTLTFTAGKLGFDGSGVRNSIDPSLNLIAQTSSGNVTATLTVTGHASKPQIVLTSTPSLPQDEVLAHLFFQQSAKQLTALQLAQIAQAIASLGGVGTGFDPMGALRRNLKLDRLSVGSTTGGASGSETQATVEGGKYVARNVYVGAKQSLSGSTQVQVQIDLTKQLKAQATVSTGTNANSTTGSAAQDSGSSVGLSYQFEY
ncbi:MAG: translocation/assembly module TamB domain-containing protein [Rhizomicrobium sp.]